jgi:DNA adenine methylase
MVLRYPGGKTRAIPILSKNIPDGTKTLVSPFFGGGSFELSTEMTIHANDLFEPLISFWSELKKDPERLVHDIHEKMKPLITKEQFKAMKSAQKINAAEYFIINRCSFNGATFCGGFSNAAANGRLTESSLKRLLKVNLDRVTFSNMDCIDFLEMHPGEFVYADPPYYITNYMYGRDGDLHESFNHDRFANYIKGRSSKWLISYNDCKYIRDLYSNFNIISVSWSYGMNVSKKSSEILIRNW